MGTLRVLLLEPYDSGSHRAWMRGYQAHSAHDVHILSLEGQFWQWRMLGGAVTLAERYRALGWQPHVIVASDMLDVTTFLALTRPQTARVPLALYFHENQLTYPRGPRQKLQQHYAFINYASALAADAVFFNSDFHRHIFLDELPRLLKHYPDHTNVHTVETLRARSRVLPVGVDLRRYDAHRPTAPRDKDAPPLILWNHRWEYDKNPRPFLQALYTLAEEGVPFRVALVGENTRQKPEEFLEARQRLGARVVRFGYVERFADYARLLWEADIAVSTAKQDFFGIATVEAIYCGCWPLLPRRLNYPALVPPAHHAETLYTTDAGLLHKLRERLRHPRPAPAALRAHVAAFDWRALAPLYDATWEALAQAAR